MINQQKEQYKFGYWFLQNKPILKKILLYSVIAVIALLWIYFFYILIQYLLNIKKTQDIFTDLGKNYVNYRAVLVPKDLLISSESLLSAGNNKYDAFAILNNPNTYWGANITYQFIIPGATTTAKTIFILPQEEKFITDLGLTGLNADRDVHLQILNTEWRGVKARSKLPQVSISFEQPKYAVTEFSDASNDNYSEVTATAFNHDIYGFKSMKVTVLLSSQNLPEGVGVIYLNDLLSGEKRDIQFNWPRKFAINSTMTFNVETDILDANNLLLK